MAGKLQGAGGPSFPPSSALIPKVGSVGWGARGNQELLSGKAEAAKVKQWLSPHHSQGGGCCKLANTPALNSWDFQDFVLIPGTSPRRGWD